MAIVLPHTFEDGPGHTASGVQVMDNLNTLKAAIEGVGESQVQTDAFQVGVVAAGDWLPATGFTINSATGAIGMGAVGGAAWLPGPVAGLVRTYTAPFTFTPIVPPLLPASGAYMNMGVMITASGAEAVVSVTPGAEKATEAEAIAAPAVTPAGKMCFRSVVVKNTAGVYSISAGRDRRPWARGAYNLITFTGGTLERPPGGGIVGPTTVATRLECSGASLRLRLSGVAEQSPAFMNMSIGFVQDGAPLSSKHGIHLDISASEVVPSFGFTYLYDVLPPAGSHLYQIEVINEAGSGTAKLRATSGVPLLFSAEEILRPNVNNGTA